jgi:hypothetical protein
VGVGGLLPKKRRRELSQEQRSKGIGAEHCGGVRGRVEKGNKRKIDWGKREGKRKSRDFSFNVNSSVATSSMNFCGPCHIDPSHVGSNMRKIDRGNREGKGNMEISVLA